MESHNLPRRILAITAHPDDVELFCAGTLARFRAAGCTIGIVIACRGNRGGSAEQQEQLAEQRELEATRSAQLLDVTPQFLRFSDADLVPDADTRQRFLLVMREFCPDLILTHHPRDYHHDHRVVSELVTDCCWYAASPGHETSPLTSPCAGPIPLVYCDTVTGMESEPTHLVDISPQMDLKLRMLACHTSQLARDDSGMNQLQEMATTLARHRGLQCGVGYAEGFTVCYRFGRRRPEPLFA